MTSLSTFYYTIDLLLLVYACYSWYWQASIQVRGRYRLSSIIWAIIFIWLAFTWNYIEKGDPGINIFLALFLFISIIDGFTGFADKRAVVSGYFKRTVRYSDISFVRLINVPNPKKPTVICILQTVKERQYYLRFNGEVNMVIGVLRQRLSSDARIEVQNII